jgi:hypothetical protein
LVNVSVRATEGALASFSVGIAQFARQNEATGMAQ